MRISEIARVAPNSRCPIVIDRGITNQSTPEAKSACYRGEFWDRRGVCRKRAPARLRGFWPTRGIRGTRNAELTGRMTPKTGEMDHSKQSHFGLSSRGKYDEYLRHGIDDTNVVI